MAAVKVTITLQDSQLEQIRSLVAAGQASNVSAFVQHAVHVALHDAEGWQELLTDVLEETGGPLSRSERVWADSVLNPQTKPKRPTRNKAA